MGEDDVSTTSTTRKKTVSRKKPVQKSQEVTLADALLEEGEGRTLESLQAQNGGEPAKASKMQMAIAVYEEEVAKTGGKPERKVLMKRFQEECGLTKAGSSTYVFNIRKKFQ